MKNILVINGNPNPASLSFGVLEVVIEALRASGKRDIAHDISETRDQALEELSGSVRVINLAYGDFDPVLQWGYSKRMDPNALVETSQEWLQWANHVVFIYPIWWSAEPALFKGWIDRVLTPKVAFNIGKLGPIGLLKGRTATIITSCDAPAFFYRWGPSSPIRRLSKRILGACGIRVTDTLVLGRVGFPSCTPSVREAFLRRVNAHALGIA